MTPLTPAAVTALAQQAAESPAHLDPVLVQQVCQEWAEQRETIGCGEAVLQAYDMTPKGLTEMADWLASETNGEPECQEAEIVAALRSTAVAFTAHEGWLHLAVAERNASKQRAESAESERDAALAERDALKADLKLTQGVLNAAQHRLIVWGCRDGHDEDGCPLCSAEHALLNTRESLTEARRVLREVEWAFDNGYDSEDACALCHQPRSTGHLSDCALAAVLAQEEK